MSISPFFMKKLKVNKFLIILVSWATKSIYVSCPKITIFSYLCTIVVQQWVRPKKRRQSESVLSYLLEKADEVGCLNLINTAKSDGDTPLHLATAHDSLALIQSLCAFSANPAAVNLNHETPIYIAAKHDREEIVQFLIDHDHDQGSADVRDRSEWSPLTPFFSELLYAISARG